MLCFLAEKMVESTRKMGVMINSVCKDEKKGLWEYSVANGVGGLYIIYH